MLGIKDDGARMMRTSAKNRIVVMIAFVCVMFLFGELTISIIADRFTAPFAAAIESTEAPDAGISSLPVRMRIPALSLDYEIRPMGADGNGTMLIAPYREMITWFNRSAIPGNEGNAIFGGHNTWGGVRSLLFDLYDMRIGDELEIDYADGTTLRFRLESVFIYRLRSAPADLIMDVGGEARVTLITCKWPYNRRIGTSDHRVVATFREESVFVIPDPPIRPYPPRTTLSIRPTPLLVRKSVTIMAD